MSDTLQRFHLAQGQGPHSVLEQALAELRSGRKQGHWIWFVLPQLRGLGQSPMSERYGIDNLEEAQAYLADSVLRGAPGVCHQRDRRTDPEAWSESEPPDGR